jgi:dTDP-glucose pyrophosphorylase
VGDTGLFDSILGHLFRKAQQDELDETSGGLSVSTKWRNIHPPERELAWRRRKPAASKAHEESWKYHHATHRRAMKAVLLVGGFSTTLRPITLNQPLPLLEFCNETLLMHQLRALKEAGVSEVLICVHERIVPASWDAYVQRCETELSIKIECMKEVHALGNAGAFKAAEERITADGKDAPFIVVNCDVLCTYPLRDLLHTHMKHARECTMLTTRCTDSADLRKYGVVVVDERSGRIRHFVYRPQTFVSDVINAGVYVFSPSVFKRIVAGRKVHMQEILPELANQEQLQSCLLSGHWVKMTDTRVRTETTAARASPLPPHRTCSALPLHTRSQGRPIPCPPGLSRRGRPPPRDHALHEPDRSQLGSCRRLLRRTG